MNANMEYTLESKNAEHAYQTAIVMGLVRRADVIAGIVLYRGERDGQYAFENVQTGEWVFA